jgi:hypothetical protein
MYVALSVYGVVLLPVQGNVAERNFGSFCIGRGQFFKVLEQYFSTIREGALLNAFELDFSTFSMEIGDGLSL